MNVTGLVAGLLGLGIVLSPLASAEECVGSPDAATVESAEKIEQLLENGLVQFGGYLAMVSYAQSRDDCVKAGVFEELYVSAVDAMPQTRMKVWRDWSVSPLDFKLDAASSVEGFSATCRIKFDLPRAGSPENVRVSCDNPMYKNSWRQAWKKVVFAPQNVGEGFKTAEDVEMIADYTYITEFR